jgi:serine protease
VATQHEQSRQIGPSTDDGYVPRVVVKFHDFIELPYDDHAQQHIARRFPGDWKRLVERFPGIRVSRLFFSITAEELRALVERASALDDRYDPPNFFTFFAVDCPSGTDPELVARALMRWESVEEAYVQSPPTAPPNDPNTQFQAHLGPARQAIDALYAWQVTGGNGLNVRVAAMEQGWTLNHQDLPASIPLNGHNHAFFDHGTRVLGIVAAAENGVGGQGIAYRAQPMAVSEWRTSTVHNIPDAITYAAANLRFGDILLIEAQVTDLVTFTWWPVEVETANFHAIRLTTALGISVVEPAGNGFHNLKDFGPVLDPSSPQCRDSGAIMVGAGSGSDPHQRTPVSNFGQRIDCFAWGEMVYTASSGQSGSSTTSYAPNFGGTSAAAAMIAGVAASVQGMARASIPVQGFSPLRLRALLRTVGTAAVPSAQLGVMPDLKAIVLRGLNAAPDVYLRDFVGDNGDPHTGTISASPDIILRQSLVPNPQAAFGAGSGTENSDTLSDEARTGQDNFVYVRVRNRGGMTASVDATVYWSPVSTLVTPHLWNLIGTTTIPNVQVGNILTVSNAITWSAASIPASGDFCFVAVLDTPSDPAPPLTDLLNWDNFLRVIRSNNNITWRNLNVVGNQNVVGNPSGPIRGLVELPFVIPGAPDEARLMQLEVMAQLPEGAKILLETPEYLLQAAGELPQRLDAKQGAGPYDRHDEGFARLPVRAHGRYRLDEVLLPARSRADARLLVRIPEPFLQYQFEVAVRQLYEGEEVGRVSWLLGPMEEPRAQVAAH